MNSFVFRRYEVFGERVDAPWTRNLPNTVVLGRYFTFYMASMRRLDLAYRQSSYQVYVWDRKKGRYLV